MNDHAVSDPPRNTPMNLCRLALAAVFALVLGACSGDGDSSPSTTLAPPPTTATTSTTVPSTPPETTAPPITEPVPETAPVTVPAEPTTTETSTPPDEAQIKQDVIDAAVASWTAFNELLLDPTNDDRLVAIANTRAGEALDRAIELATTYRVNKFAERTHPELPAKVEVFEDSVTLDLAAGIAIVEYCRLGSNIWVEVAANLDGTDLIMDDTINSYLEQDTFTVSDGRWVKTNGVSLAKFEGSTTCPLPA